MLTPNEAMEIMKSRLPSDMIVHNLLKDTDSEDGVTYWSAVLRESGSDDDIGWIQFPEHYTVPDIIWA